MNSHDANRLIAAVERIATAQEALVSSDPLAMLQQAIDDGDVPEMAPQEPQGPYASNGATVIYRHPTDGYEIVARRDEEAEGGYTVAVERS